MARQSNGLTRRAGGCHMTLLHPGVFLGRLSGNDLAQGVVDKSIALSPKETKVDNLEILIVDVFISPITF
jgi:hypothetical protein